MAIPSVRSLQRYLFQSSPPPKERCNHVQHALRVPPPLFQSSPPPKERCNTRSPSTLHSRGAFNPHRPRRSGAIRARDTCSAHGADFQSSPPPKERCNSLTLLTRWCVAFRLSILTAPEGAVQWRNIVLVFNCQIWLSILTAPEGAVQFLRLYEGGRCVIFQSSPPPKERCNLLAVVSKNPALPAFNPHRPRRSGAMLDGAPRRGADRDLSILTAPEGAVQYSAHATHAQRQTVLSILTAPEGAVQ